MAITSVPISVNEDLRPSRLVKSIPSYIKRSIGTIVRIFAVYQPFKFFGSIGLVLFGLGFLVGLRFLWFFFQGDGDGHVQSLILSGALLVMGFQAFLAAFLADLLAANRKLLEDIRFKTRRSAVSSISSRVLSRANQESQAEESEVAQRGDDAGEQGSQ